MTSAKVIFHTTFALLCALLLAFAAASSACAAERMKRVALIIGNADYKDAPLINPINDAKDIAAMLRTLRFEVIELTNATQKEMNRAIAQFGTKLHADAMALFYFAGHGLQVKGKNYLVPIDAEITGEASIRAETVDVDAVLDQIGASELNLVILDACRNNPFERKYRSMGGGGLAQMDAPKGTMIAYATAPGKVAMDGDGRNGMYTQELLKQMATPGLPVEAVFKNVRRGVARMSGDQQIPWESSSLTGEFYFNTGRGIAPTPSDAPTKSAAATSPNPAPAAPEAAPTQVVVREPAPEVLAKAAPTPTVSVTPSPAAKAALPEEKPSAPTVQTLNLADRVLTGAFQLDSKGAATGKGQGSFKNGDSYEGDFVANKRQGQGRLTEKGGDFWEGEFFDDKFTGKGKMTVRFGQVTMSGDFTQDLKTGKMTGKGVMRWQNGDQYDGQVVNGIKTGRGSFTWTNGQRYVGDWQDDVQQGKGSIHYPSGDRYEGDMVKGAPHGQGSYIWKDGTVFSGLWSAGKRNGLGRVTQINGLSEEGEYRDDELVGPARTIGKN